MKTYAIIVALLLLSSCSQKTPQGTTAIVGTEPTTQAAAGESPGAGLSDLDAAISTAGDAILAAINVRRALSGIPPLIQLPELTNIAMLRATDLTINGYLGHVDPRSGEVAVMQLLLDSGFNKQAAELLFRSQVALSTVPNEVVEAWFLDSDNRLVLLSPEFHYGGVGIMGDGQAWVVTAVVTGESP
jgi:uncharacterized protein YkwD